MQTKQSVQNETKQKKQKKKYEKGQYSQNNNKDSNFFLENMLRVGSFVNIEPNKQ